MVRVMLAKVGSFPSIPRRADAERHPSALLSLGLTGLGVCVGPALARTARSPQSSPARAPPRAPERAYGELCRRVELSRIHESSNTQPLGLRFRALLTSKSSEAESTMMAPMTTPGSGFLILAVGRGHSRRSDPGRREAGYPQVVGI
jgi:hypothetical protein